ncbi:MAG: Tat pathway signal protein [Bacteroidetes bacterium]|nr:Tat pathway signal protein [Bacteroidota bacterium]MBU1580838.1 Tat pathway signal protein [Bacteroidota bacterium]MBU2465871.1 Tat pathway signal protein [Bacteroidota bacterium]MBU2558388.1 Tat pathway signal protein [Bacteroidota bacterium]
MFVKLIAVLNNHFTTRKRGQTNSWLQLSTLLMVIFLLSCKNQAQTQKAAEKPATITDKKLFLDDLKQRTFNYFWDIVDSASWQSDDRYPSKQFTSIAATGFALPAYIIGVENQYISRNEAAKRVNQTLLWLWEAPMGTAQHHMSGYKGFYYHFLKYGEGTRYKDVELSSIDTGLLMAGILTTQSYFDGDNPIEQQIRELADSLFLRVEWNWMMNDAETMSMGWKPESGFLDAQWKGYNEAMILLLMAMGSPTHPIAANSWQAWTASYDWVKFEGYEHINFGPLFGHQYSHMFIDFREIHDAYMKDKGIDYFENSRRATLSNRAYCMRNPFNFKGYGKNIWGLTASDGPGAGKKTWKNQTIDFKAYNARGVAFDYLQDDGTIAPTAAGGSIPFAPKETTDALFTMYQRYGDQLYRQYGFADAFNLSVSEAGWFAPDYIGIDQGALLIQLENHDSELIWNILKKNKYLKEGLIKAGFSGGWLTSSPAKI